MSSELKVAREAKLSAEKDLVSFQAMAKNSRVEAVQDLSTSTTVYLLSLSLSLYSLQ